MFRKKTSKLDAEGLWQYSLRALAARGLSIGEMRQRLKDRAGDEADVAATLDKLKQYGMIDDRRLADTFAAARKENQGLGRGRVTRDLRKRRVAPSLVEEAVERAYKGSDEKVLIADFLKRKYRSVDLRAYLADPKHMASAYRRLRYAGFSVGNSIRVLRQYSESAAELESVEEE